MQLDYKQRQIIDAWLERASAASSDEYTRFMSAWIAFNALCYGLFAQKASRRRPDLSDDKGLEGLTGEVCAEGTIVVRVDGRVRLQLDRPGRIRIDISDRYTEERVFSEFAAAFQSRYLQWLEAPTFATALDKFLSAIRRPGGAYVINMLKAHEHREDREIEEMVGRNVVALIADRRNLKQLVGALYQVRNNLFHGEKVPAEVNDDRIVRAARPILEMTAKHAYVATAEPAAASDDALRRG